MQLLSLLLLLQALFPMQLHTQLALDGQGNVVEVCTLDGFKTVEIDDQRRIKEKDTQNTDRNAAMALSDLMAGAMSDVSVIAFIAEVPASYVVSSCGQSVVVNYADGLKPIRAPPLLIV